MRVYIWFALLDKALFCEVSDPIPGVSKCIRPLRSPLIDERWNVLLCIVMVALSLENIVI